VRYVKGGVINGEKLEGGIIHSFDEVFSVYDIYSGTITELLEIAEEKAKQAGGMLIRTDWIAADDYPDDGEEIIEAEIMDFLF